MSRLSLSAWAGSLVGDRGWSERKGDARRSEKNALACYTGHKWHEVEHGPNSDKTGQNVFPRCPFILPPAPRGRAVSQRLSSLSPSLAHPFFGGIRSSTHLFIRHIRDKQTVACMHADAASLQTCALFDPADTQRTHCTVLKQELYYV